jgi:acyl-CoA reductase-like NAD-dependent aldehyde dehydrogenase
METNWIGNRAVPSDTSDALAVINPATEEALGAIPTGSAGDIGQAVAAARSAQAEWGGLSPVARRAALYEISSILLEHKEELARLNTMEMGKPLFLSRNEIVGAATAARQFGELAVHIRSGAQQAAHGELNFQQRFPRGVVGVIVPWNYPVALGVENVSAAIAVGNTVVWKPSEKTPLTSRRIAELAFSRLPAGVVNLVLGNGPGAGQPLVDHPDVNAILFVGSEATGRKIGESCGRNLKKVILELGGKDPLIIDETVDVEKAAALAIDAAYFNAGQLCTATERVYVARQIFEPFVEALTRQSKAIVQDDGLVDNVGMGPIVDRIQLDKIIDQVDRSVAAGAVLHCGGARVDRKGWFYPPTVITGVTADQPVMADETFGPVAPVVPFDDFDEAIALANDHRYGLAAVLCSNSAARSLKFLHEIRAGMLKVNAPPRKAPGGTSEPVGASGIGAGYGQELLLELTRQSSVQWKASI